MSKQMTIDCAIETEYIQLDALLKYSGVCSTGGEAKCIILDGEVAVNGEKCMKRGKKIWPGDYVSLSDRNVSVNVIGC